MFSVAYGTEFSVFSQVDFAGGESREPDESASLVPRAPSNTGVLCRDLTNASAMQFILGQGTSKLHLDVAPVAVDS